MACAECGGTGFVLYRKFVPDLNYEAEFARPCECRQQQKAIGERFSDFSWPDGFPEMISHLTSHTSDWMEEGSWLYVWSETPGCGKTTLAKCIESGIGSRAVYTTVNDYIQSIMRSWKRDPGEEDESAVCREADILILDDFGQIRSGGIYSEIIDDLLDRRMEGKVNVFLASAPPERLNVSRRTLDRIKSRAFEMRLPEKSFRRENGTVRKREFWRDKICRT